MKNYKPYYDFAVDIYNATPKIENGSIVAKPLIKDYVSYNNYFDVKTSDAKKRKKDEKQNSMRNNSKIITNKEHESLANLSRSGQNQMSFSSNSMNKRVSSAKNKREKDKK